MDNFLSAFPFASHEQQMCNVALMNAYTNLANTPHSMNYIGYGPQVGQVGALMQPFIGTENAEDDDCDDDDDDEDDEQSRTLFCSNLDERVTEEILYEVFLQAGPIESARIPLDNAGRQRNFGFVTYQHKSAVPYAVELYQGLELYQKKVTIRQQCPDKPKPKPFVAGPARMQHNPFSIDLATPNGRHSLHDSKQFGVQNKYNNNNNNNDVRRRSDSAIIDRKRSRSNHQQQQHHHSSGGNRRSDQRYNNNHGKRRLL
ncbi:hypothetical protein ACLKA6_019089 [Drosophila palustris]